MRLGPAEPPGGYCASWCSLEKSHSREARCCCALDDSFSHRALYFRCNAPFKSCDCHVLVRGMNLRLYFPEPLLSFGAPGASNIDDEGYQRGSWVPPMFIAFLAQKPNFQRDALVSAACNNGQVYVPWAARHIKVRDVEDRVLGGRIPMGNCLFPVRVKSHFSHPIV